MSQFPQITINVAQSINGYIAGRFGRRVVISSDEDRMRVMQLRASSDAILVGANTIINDNPDLKAIPPGEKKPVRVLLDGRLSVPTHSRIFDGTQRTIVFTSNRERRMINCELIYAPDIDIKIDFILEKLAEIGVKKLLIEGGSMVINKFILSGYVDIFYLYTGNCVIESDGVRLFNIENMQSGLIQESNKLGDGFLLKLDPNKVREGLIENGRRGLKTKLG